MDVTLGPSGVVPTPWSEKHVKAVNLSDNATKQWWKISIFLPFIFADYLSNRLSVFAWWPCVRPLCP